ncbi:hypothetical protein [Undibacterium sp. Ren11W]|uniref:hypothetical protein n=1 Tax=Undibacterium sp. Ren11W TaxID=3413045 RepID=UPI003BEFCA6D
MQFRVMPVLLFFCLSSLSALCAASIRESTDLEYHGTRAGDRGNSVQLQESIRNSQKQAGIANPKRNRLSVDERQILRKQIREAENEIYYFNK